MSRSDTASPLLRGYRQCPRNSKIGRPSKNTGAFSTASRNSWSWASWRRRLHLRGGGRLPPGGQGRHQNQSQQDGHLDVPYPGGAGGEKERVSQTFQPSGRFAASNS